MARLSGLDHISSPQRVEMRVVVRGSLLYHGQRTKTCTPGRCWTRSGTLFVVVQQTSRGTYQPLHFIELFVRTSPLGPSQASPRNIKNDDDLVSRHYAQGQKILRKLALPLLVDARPEIPGAIQGFRA